MGHFILFASPWWANILIFVPIVCFIIFNKKKLSLSKSQLITAAIFGMAFGFIEAATVVYLRAALGFLPGFSVSLAQAAKQSLNIYQQTQALGRLPQSLMAVEIFRELATLVILVATALLAARSPRERWAVFLWLFAAWDIFYYVGLWLVIRWPYSLTTPDVLFLIPVPWLAEVWFPILVSILTMLAIFLCNES